MGEVKIQSASRTAWVYLDGALAGRADKLRHIWLDPGAYTLELRDGGHHLSQRIYVISGNTLRISAEMMKMTEAHQ